MAIEPTYGGLTEQELRELCKTHTGPSRLDENNTLGMAAREALPALLDEVNRLKDGRHDFYSISITVTGSVPFDKEAETVGDLMERLRNVLEPALLEVPGFRPGHPSVVITASHIGRLHERPYDFSENPEVQRLRRIEQAARYLEQAESRAERKCAADRLSQLLEETL